MPKSYEIEGWEILTGFTSLKGALAAPKCLRQVLTASLSLRQPGLSGREPVYPALMGKPSKTCTQAAATAGCLETPHSRTSKAAFTDCWLMYFVLAPKIYKRMCVHPPRTVQGSLKPCPPQARTPAWFQGQGDPIPVAERKGLVHTPAPTGRGSIFCPVHKYMYRAMVIVLRC